MRQKRRMPFLAPHPSGAQWALLVVAVAVLVMVLPGGVGLGSTLPIAILTAAVLLWIAPFRAYLEERAKEHARLQTKAAADFPFDVYRAADLTELMKKRIGPGSSIPYQRRSNPEVYESFRRQLRENRKVLITGRSGLGKTRECLEYLTAIQENSSEEVFVLFPRRGFDRPGVGALPSDFAPRHVVLFVDDIDQHARDEDPLLGVSDFQTRLSNTVAWMQEEYAGRDWRVLVVAREEPELARIAGLYARYWDDYFRIQLRRIHRSEAAAYITEVAAHFGVTLTPAATDHVVELFDGTPAAVVAALTRVASTDPRPPSPVTREYLMATGYQFRYPDDWESSSYRTGIHPFPARRALLDALSVLRGAGIPTHEFLVVELAARLHEGRAPKWWRRRSVRKAVTELSAYVFDFRGALICEDAYLRGRLQASAALPALVASLKWCLRRPSLRREVTPHLPAIGWELEQTLGRPDAALLLLTARKGDGVTGSRILASRSALLARLEEHDGALDAAEAAVASNPSSSRALIMLSNALSTSGEHARAESVARDAVKVAPFSDSAWVNLGVLLSKRGYLDAAIEALERARKLNPGNVGAAFSLGIAYERAGRVRMGVKACMEAVRLAPENGEAWHSLGIGLERAGHPKWALGALRRAVQTRPRPANIALTIARVADRVGDKRELQSILEAMLRTARTADDWAKLSVVAGVAGNAAMAVKAARAALALNTNRFDAWRTLSLNLSDSLPEEVEAKELEHAASEMERLARTAREWYQVSAAWGSIGDYPRAASAARRAVEADPRNYGGWRILALSLQSSPTADGGRGDLEDAIAAMERLARSADEWHQVGAAWGRLGEHERAVSAAQRALDLQPDHYGAWRILGLNLQAASPSTRDPGRLGAAIAELERLARTADKWHHVSAAWGTSGEHGRAVAAARRALQLDPNHFGAWRSLNLNLRAAPSEALEPGELEHSIAEMERLARSADQWHQVSAAWGTSGVRDRAIAAARKAVELDPDHYGAWRSLSINLREPHPDPERLMHLEEALRQMERLARHADEWAQVSVGWRSIGALERAMAASERATDSEANSFAYWRSVSLPLTKQRTGTGLSDALDQVLSEMERHATRAGDWCQVGAAWGACGEHRRAVSAARRAVGLDPNLFGGWQLLSVNLQQLPRGVETVQEWETVLANMERLAQSPREWHAVAAGRGQTGDHARAVAAARRATELDPDLYGAWQSLSVNLKHLFQDEATEAEAHRVRLEMERLARSPDEWHQVSVAWGLARSPAKSVQAARMALEMNPDHFGAWVTLCLDLRHLPADAGRLAELEHARQELERLASDAEEWNWVATVWGMAGEARKAVAAARTALQHDPEHAGACANLGRNLMLLSPSERDLEEFLRVIETLEQKATDVEDWCVLGTLWGSAGEQQKAVDATQKAVTIDGTSLRAWETHARSLEFAGAMGEAAAAWRIVAGLRTGDANHGGRLEEARRRLRVEPDSRAAWERFAHESWLSGAADAALDRAREALGETPELHAAVFGAAYALLGVGGEAVIPLLRRLVEVAPDVAEYRQLLGAMLRKAGDASAAVAELEVACAAAPGRRDYWYTLGRALEDVGNASADSAARVEALKRAVASHSKASELGHIKAALRIGDLSARIATDLDG